MLKHLIKGKPWSEEVFSTRNHLLSLDSVAQVANEHTAKLFFVENTGLVLFPFWNMPIFNSFLSLSVVITTYIVATALILHLHCCGLSHVTLQAIKSATPLHQPQMGAGISSHRLDTFHPESLLSAADKWQPDDNLFLITTLAPH